MEMKKSFKNMTKMELTDMVLELHEDSSKLKIETATALQEAKKAKDELSVAKSELHVSEMTRYRLQGYIDRVREMETQNQEAQHGQDRHF